MSEMVERVAKAVVAKLQPSVFCGGDEACDSLPCSCALDIARAAIEAIREPTDEMLDAGWGQRGERARGIWRLMIDAALKE